ncbi:hypothetical protein BDV06DRAFT_213813 [Aspergillus oleicola]
MPSIKISQFDDVSADIRAKKLLIIGIFAEVYLVNGKFIRKVPRSANAEDMESIAREAEIYSLIGPHPRIAECLSMDRIDHVDVKFYQYGDLAAYRKVKGLTPELQARCHGAVHSDLSPRQFFYSGHLVLGDQKASHCLPRDNALPNTERSDIFAIGPTLYELIVGRAPYAELWASGPEPDPASPEIEKRFREGRFPDVSYIFRGDVISGCWRGDYSPLSRFSSCMNYKEAL